MFIKCSLKQTGKKSAQLTSDVLSEFLLPVNSNKNWSSHWFDTLPKHLKTAYLEKTFCLIPTFHSLLWVPCMKKKKQWSFTGSLAYSQERTFTTTQRVSRIWWILLPEKPLQCYLHNLNKAVSDCCKNEPSVAAITQLHPTQYFHSPRYPF